MMEQKTLEQLKIEELEKRIEKAEEKITKLEDKIKEYEIEEFVLKNIKNIENIIKRT